jgi:hypothetical protein
MRRRDQKRLQLELLESRVMLSATDESTDGVSPDTVLEAIHSNGLDIAVRLTSMDRMVVIQGPGHGNVTIDLSQLPESTRSLQISSFDSVTLIGELSVDSLVVSNVDRLDAGRISIGTNSINDGFFSDGLYAYGVDQIRIDVAPVFIVLEGADRKVGGRTLLEAGRFSEGGYIFSSLDSLGLATTDSVQDLSVVSFNQKQIVLLNFQPTNLHIGENGFLSPDQVSVVQGDFSRYFAATPVERSSLEQSHLIVRQAAITSPVSLSKVLSNPGAQAALATMIEGAPSAAHTHLRPLVDSEFSRAPVESPESEIVSGTIAAAGSTPQPVIDLSATVPLVPWDAPASSGSMTDVSPLGLEGQSVLSPISHSAAEPSDDSVASAVVAALARLTEPFTQTVLDLRGGAASYGDLASARFADSLKTDRQPPLLVNARSARQSNDGEILVLMV